MTLSVVVTHRFEGTPDHPAEQRLNLQAAVTVDDLPTKVVFVLSNRHQDGRELTLDEALDDAVARLILAVVEQVKA